MGDWKSRIAPLLILAVALALRVEDPRAVELARLWTFDTYQRISPRPFEALPVRIADIDDESLRRFGQWPWPRTRIAELVDRLGDLGAAAIAFDVLFAEPDRTSPAALSRTLSAARGADPGAAAALREALAALPDHDRELARAFEGNRVVTGFSFSRDDAGTPLPRPKAGIGVGGSQPHPFLPGYPSAIPSLPVLDDAAAGLGSINFDADADGLIRRVPLFAQLAKPGARPDSADPFDLPPVYPSLVPEALRVAQGAGGFTIRMADASGEGGGAAATGVAEVRIGGFPVATDEAGRVWLYYSGHRADRFVPIWRILEGELDPAEADALAGAIVLVGTTAPGLLDLRATPLDPVLAGVEIHAELAEQIMTGRYLVRPDWAFGAELAAFAVLGGLLVALLPTLGVGASAIVCVLAIGAGIAASWLAFRQEGLLLDPVYPAVVVLLIYLSSSLITYLRSEGQRRRIRSAFGQYLSPALVEQLAEHPERLRLGGERREMTFLFCDVRGFTAISEGLRDDPEALTGLINRLLTPLTGEILDRSGTIDKYMGDCIMAFWNAPLDDADHARHACEAALAMLAALDRLNREREAEAGGRPVLPLAVGVGLNTGECIVGNMGSDQRFDYSVLGDAVNLASRLEGLSRVYGVPVVVGDSTRSQVADSFAFLELDLVAVKGRREPVRIHALIGDGISARSPDFRALAACHGRMVDAYRAGEWRRAAEALAECRAFPGAPAALYALYEDRISALAADPPPSGWSGIHVAETK